MVLCNTLAMNHLPAIRSTQVIPRRLLIFLSMSNTIVKIVDCEGFQPMVLRHLHAWTFDYFVIRGLWTYVTLRHGCSLGWDNPRCSLGLAREVKHAVFFCSVVKSTNLELIERTKGWKISSRSGVEHDWESRGCENLAQSSDSHTTELRDGKQLPCILRAVQISSVFWKISQKLAKLRNLKVISHVCRGKVERVLHCNSYKHRQAP